MTVPKAIFRMSSVFDCGADGWTKDKFPTILCDITKLGAVLTWLGEKHPDLVSGFIVQQYPVDCPDGSEWIAYEVAIPKAPKTLIDYLASRYPDWAADV